MLIEGDLTSGGLKDGKDFFDGSIGLVVGGFELTDLGTVLLVGAVVELAGGEGAAEAAMEEEEQNRLVPALRAVCEGRVWLPRSVLERVARATLGSPEKTLPLTAREAEVINLIAEGLSNKEVASRLGVTEKTVKFHASNLFAKLGSHDRASAVEMAHSRNLCNAA